MIKCWVHISVCISRTKSSKAGELDKDDQQILGAFKLPVAVWWLEGGQKVKGRLWSDKRYQKYRSLKAGIYILWGLRTRIVAFEAIECQEWNQAVGVGGWNLCGAALCRLRTTSSAVWSIGLLWSATRQQNRRGAVVGYPGFRCQDNIMSFWLPLVSAPLFCGLMSGRSIGIEKIYRNI